MFFNMDDQPTHRADLPAGTPLSARTRLVLLSTVSAAFVAVAGVALHFANEADTFAGPEKTSQTVTGAGGEVVDAGIARNVDVAVTQTLVAATRLDTFDGAGKSRRAVILSRAQANLTATTTALAKVTGADFDEPVDVARNELANLVLVVSGLQKCVANEQAEAQKRQGKKPVRKKRVKTPPACAVTAAEVETARATGTAVAALIPYGTLSTSDFEVLAVAVREDATAEAKHGSRSTVTVPDRFEPPAA